MFSVQRLKKDLDGFCEGHEWQASEPLPVRPSTGEPPMQFWVAMAWFGILALKVGTIVAAHAR